MNALEHMFWLLVEHLAARDTALLSAPLRVREIVQNLFPYQDARGVLGLECSEDYELLVLRLCAGHDDLAHAIDPEILTVFAREVQSPHPDLEVLRTHAEAEVLLRPEAVARARTSAPPDGYAPPGHAARGVPATPTPAPAPAEPGAPPALLPLPAADPDVLELPRTPSGSTEEATLERCLYCGGSLPAVHEVKFCPHCGQSQAEFRCPGCGADLDLGWRHCINCGRAVPSP